MSHVLCCRLKSVIFQKSNTRLPQPVSFLVEGEDQLLWCLWFAWVGMCAESKCTPGKMFPSPESSTREHMCNEINLLFCYKTWYVPTGGTCSGRELSGTGRLFSHNPKFAGNLCALVLFLKPLDHSCGDRAALLAVSVMWMRGVHVSHEGIFAHQGFLLSLPSFFFFPHLQHKGVNR